jgi:NADH-quinone oxidoreductase subunit F
MTDYKPMILKGYLSPKGHLRDIAEYEAQGGYQMLKKAFAMKPDDIVNEVKKSGLKGRGGAGFPTGLKWSFLAKPEGKPRYLLVNGDESEPGTFKDRQILSKIRINSLKGLSLPAMHVVSMRATSTFAANMPSGFEMVEKAVAEAYAKGYLGENILGSGFSLKMVVHKGAGAYICGEETGLISSIEGKRAYPRLKPPFPAVVGAWGSPTIINNVETICNIPIIVGIGADAYSKIGAPDHPGPMLFGISGHVNKPGVYEAPAAL